MTTPPPAVVTYRVRDVGAARAFYAEKLGLEDVGTGLLRRGDTLVDLVEGEPEDDGVASIKVTDAKAEAERLREAGVRVGVVLELHGHVRIVDVFDPDGNRLQLVEEL